MRFVRPQDDIFARAFFDSVRFARLDYAVQRLSPALWQQHGVRDSLARVAAFLPHGSLDSMHLVGAFRYRNDSSEQSSLTYEYHSAQGWGATTINILHQQGIHYVFGIHADTMHQSLEALNVFRLRGKSAGHYLMLLMLVACAGTAITAAVRTLRTPMPRRWLWVLFSLVGTSTFAFNWTTGQVGFSLLTVRLFVVGFAQGVASTPWILSVSFPIGALLAIRRVQQARTTLPAAAVPVSVPPDALPVAIPKLPASLGSDGNPASL